MKNLRISSLLAVAVTACAAVFTGCIKEPNNAPGRNGSEIEGKFAYENTTNIKIDVDYCMKGNKALFEVYAENPLANENGAIVKKANARAQLKAYTDYESRYSGVVNLPTSTEKVYLYSEAYGLPTCVAVKIGANGISLNLDAYLAARQTQGSGKAARSVSTRAGENPYNIYPLEGWNKDGLPYNTLGTWYGDLLDPVWAEIPNGLMNRIQSVLLPGENNGAFARPTEVVNINVKEDAKLTLVFLAEMAAYRNGIGYYFYDSKNPPRTQAEMEALPKYVAFPNCTSYFIYGFDDDIYYSSGNDSWAPLHYGTQVPMQYTKDGKTSEVFPAGTTIGWFILPDGFDPDTRDLDLTGKKHAIRYSNNEFNKNQERYMVSLYDKKSGKTVLGFEDSSEKSQGDFKDVLFYIDATPESAIDDPNRPTTDPDEQYPDVVGDPIQGTLAFEDLWPSQGDYDMNDMVIAYSTTFTTDKENRIVAIRDVFTPLHNGGQLKSAFGYQLEMSATDIASVKIENGSSSASTLNGLETKQSKPVIMLFDDLEKALTNGAITVDIELRNGIALQSTTRKSLYNPFICVRSIKEEFAPGEPRKEVHLTNYAPTSLADPYPFGRDDDKSSVDKQGNPIGPYYYVTTELYPFAIDLPISDYHIPGEMTAIDIFYPGFAGWASSNGEKNKDWYLKPAK